MKRSVWLNLRAMVFSVSLFAITGLAGCLPVRSTYYNVSSPVGIIGGECGSTGKSTTLVFMRDEVKIYIHEIIIMGDLASLSISFFVPQNEEASFDWNQLQAINNLNGKAIGSEPIKVIVSPSSQESKFINLQPGIVLSGDQYPAEWGGRVYSRYDISFSNFPKDLTPGFDLRIPDISVNGNTYSGFTIHYQLVTSTWLQSVNC